MFVGLVISQTLFISFNEGIRDEVYKNNLGAGLTPCFAFCHEDGRFFGLN